LRAAAITNAYPMIKNYFKIALRNLLRERSFSILNISGLAIGIACSILILLWVQDQSSYDRFHANADQIYRITEYVGDLKYAVTPPGMAEGVQKEFPEITAAVRLSKPSTTLFQVGERKFEETRVFYADSNFLKVFSFRLVNGNTNTAMRNPDGVLITENMAKKYFGDQEALGKTIRQDGKRDVVVTGILANAPSNSHLQFDFILPISAIEYTDDDLKNKVWDDFTYYTYLQLDKNFANSPSNLLKLTPGNQ
jgi:putative ABC transport system permease protein